jgi:hypothetical protein
MRFAQRLEKLEKTIGRLQQPDRDAPEKERSDEEEADRMGAFLWGPPGDYMDKYPPRSPTSVPPAGPLRAWHEAAELARQEGHREYHTGLRPYAMAVWLDRKPGILKERRDHRDWVRVHGEWVCDVEPRYLNLTMAEFEKLSTEEKIAALLDHGSGHWSKDGKRAGR